jgi:hypothetical protein
VSRPLVVRPEAELALVPGSAPYLVAEHVRTPMAYGAALPVRFTFSTGDAVEVDVSMAPPTYPVTAPTPAPSVTGVSSAAAGWPGPIAGRDGHATTHGLLTGGAADRCGPCGLVVAPADRGALRF